MTKYFLLPKLDADGGFGGYDAGDVERALSSHKAKQVSVMADGTVELDAETDPSPTWASFQPTFTPTLTLIEIAEAVLGTAADRAKLSARLAAIKTRRGG